MKLERHHLVVTAVLTIFIGMACGGGSSSEREALDDGLVVPESGQIQPTALSSPLEVAGVDASPTPQAGAGEWPFIMTAPEGSEFFPIEAASVTHTTMLWKDWADLMKFRSELHQEILLLDALHTDRTINEEEGHRCLDVLARLANIDNFLMGLDQELEMARVMSTVDGNLG